MNNKCTQPWSELLKEKHANGMSLFHTKARSFADLLFLNDAYLRGVLTSSMSCVGPLMAESNSILRYLLHLNKHALFTTSSQPPLNEDTAQQRPYVEGFMEKEWFELHIRKKLDVLDTSDILYHISTVPRGNSAPALSNIHKADIDLGVPYPVTNDLIGPEWEAVTHLYFSSDLQEVEQFFVERFDSGALVQCIFTSEVWNDVRFFELLVKIFDVEYTVHG